MSCVICSKCSHIIEVNGRMPKSCPACGFTLDIAADATRTLDRSVELPETVVSPADEPLGTFGRYVVECKLGSGGFGTVYRARDPKLNRPVAIKIPDPSVKQTPASIERFAREGRNAAQLRHPGIVSVYTVEEDHGQIYIVSEYVDGEPLAYQFKKGKMSYRAATSLLATIASAVDYAHSKGVTHRDIKPGNIMIDALGNPRLMDFGLAKHEHLDATVTAMEQVLGTPAYMSPEQARGKPQGIDRRTDIYSLGATFYHLLTKELPFQGQSHEVRAKVLAEEPKRPRLIDKEIPVDLETICLKAMEKDPAKRYQTARELAEDLERWLRGEPIVARHISPFERSVRWCRRNPAPAGTIASVALLLVALAAGSSVLAAVQATARRNADNARTVADNARIAADTARKEIAEALQKNQELLSRAYGERGERHLRVAETSDDYAPLKSLPWFLEAMKLDEKNPDRLLTDRIRLQTLLDSSPRVERMWFFNGVVTASGVSPKRDKFFIAGRDGTVNIWQIEGDGAPISLAHPGSVSTAAFSPDGTRLATGADDGLRIWETQWGKCLKGPLVPPRAPSTLRRRVTHDTRSVVFGKKGGFLYAYSGGDVNQVWNVDTGQPTGKAILSQGRPTTAEFADSDRLLVLNFGGATRVYDAVTGNEKHSSVGGKDPFSLARVSPNGVTIASCSEAGQVVFLDAISSTETAQSIAPESSTRYDSSGYSPDGKLFATGAEDGTVRTWNVADGQLLWKRQIITGRAAYLQFSPDGTFIAAGRMGRKLCILNVRSGTPVAGPITVNVGLDVKAAEWLAPSRRILTIDSLGVARRWNVENQVPASLLPVMAARRAALSGDRCVVAVAEKTKDVCVLRSGPDGRFNPLDAQRLTIGHLSIDAIALTEDGSRIAVSAEGQVFVFDSLTRKQINGPLLHASNVPLMRFTSEGKRLICVSFDGRAVVWDLQKGTRLYEPIMVSRDPQDIDVDNEGSQCAVAAQSGVTVWGLASGKKIRPGFLGGVISRFARFLDDPARVLIGGSNQTVQIWDTATGNAVISLPQHPLSCLDLSADKRQFLTGYANGMARLWFAHNGAPASPPLEHPSAVYCGMIDPSGRFVLTLTQDFDIFLWDAKSAEVIATISLPHLESQLGLPESRPSNTSKDKPFVFFSRDSRFGYVLTQQGLLVTLGLEPDGRSEKEISADIAIRTHVAFDGAGGLRNLNLQELAAQWKTVQQLAPAIAPAVRLNRVRSHPNNDGKEATSEPQISRR